MHPEECSQVYGSPWLGLVAAAGQGQFIFSPLDGSESKYANMLFFSSASLSKDEILLRIGVDGSHNYSEFSKFTTLRYLFYQTQVQF